MMLVKGVMNVSTNYITNEVSMGLSSHDFEGKMLEFLVHNPQILVRKKTVFFKRLSLVTEASDDDCRGGSDFKDFVSEKLTEHAGQVSKVE